ncbi:ABC transporter ATP-binding protein [bacterium]|nr:ABC transporter ATP-binding protein [bacterium]
MWRFLFGVATLILVDLFQLFIPLVVRRAFDALSLGNATSSMLLKLSAIILLLALGVIIARFFWRYLIIGISRKMEMRLRKAFYSHLLTLSPGWFSGHKVGDLMALATNDLDAVRMMAGIGTVAFVDTLFLMITALGMMIYINPRLTMYVIIPLPVLSIIVGFVGRIMFRRFKLVQESFAKMTDFVREVISGIRVVKSYVREETETRRFKEISRDYVHKNLRMVIIQGMFEPLIGLVIGLSFALVLFLGGKRVILATMSMGDFVAFNSYLGLLIWPMIAIGWVINLYQRGKASLTRIMEVFEQKPQITDLPDAKSVEKFWGEIEFRNLTFRYKPELEPVLRNISFHIDAGQFVGITGRTGSGKTTLISLLPRLFDPPDNTIFIDGNDIRRIKLSSLRSAIALVPQDSFLFSTTLMENIKFGNPEAGDDEAIAASRIAQFHKDVKNFPDGYNTLIGERGVTLSGGQKQRLAIARAILLDPPILILDDALSAVDTETEEEILEALKKIRAGKTTLVVSHRISALQEADIVVVLRKGEIAEIGAPQNLLTKAGYYAELYRMQQIQSELNDVQK